MEWIVLGVCVVGLGILVLGGICHAAGMADREIERIENETKGTE